MKRELTPEEKLRTERLKKIWAEKKKLLNLTQEKAGLECGWNGQSAFSQYLGGYAVINMKTAIKLAKVLKVNPTEIMPELAEFQPSQIKKVETTRNTNEGLTPEAIEMAKLWEKLPPEQKALLEQTVKTFISANQRPEHKAA